MRTHLTTTWLFTASLLAALLTIEPTPPLIPLPNSVTHQEDTLLFSASLDVSARDKAKNERNLLLGFKPEVHRLT
ncbi:hypothetical protein [Rubritalea sp.]|uniref:hypothetical protein n=1 Tax=Rubritalea sp. TaxID=2109375 RepID=UPI003241FFB1